jgi:hypothetical protein
VALQLALRVLQLWLLLLLLLLLGRLWLRQEGLLAVAAWVEVVGAWPAY